MTSKRNHVSFATCDSQEVLLQQLQKQILSMRRFRAAGTEKPHKLVMLLSVIDLTESGLVFDGRVYLDKGLLERFSFYFRIVGQPTDSCRPHIPFFHLRALGWWQLQPKMGREKSFTDMKTCHSAKELMDNVECARIAEEVYDLLLDQRARWAVRRTIAEALGVPEIANLTGTTDLQREKEGG